VIELKKELHFRLRCLIDESYLLQEKTIVSNHSPLHVVWFDPFHLFFFLDCSKYKRIVLNGMKEGVIYTTRQESRNSMNANQ